MTFEPPRPPTRMPPPLIFAISVAAIAAVAGGAYLLLFNPYNKPARGEAPVEQPILTGDEPSASGAVEDVSRPARITIPAIGVDGPVLEMRLGPDGLWDAESIIGEVGHLQGTPWPGQGGNSVLAAHVTVPEGAYGPFKDLETMQPGQDISIWAYDGTLYNYNVVENKMVSATAIEVIEPTEQPTLTLVTCSGWDEDQRNYLERIVVTARLSEVVPPSQ